MSLNVNSFFSKLFVLEDKQRESFIKKQEIFSQKNLVKPSTTAYTSQTNNSRKNNSNLGKILNVLKSLEKNSELEKRKKHSSPGVILGEEKALKKNSFNEKTITSEKEKKKPEEKHSINIEEFEPNQHQLFVKVERILTSSSDNTIKNSITTMDSETEKEDQNKPEEINNIKKEESNNIKMAQTESSTNLPIAPHELNQINERVVRILQATKNYNNRADILAYTLKNEEGASQPISNDGSLSPTLGETSIKMNQQEGMYKEEENKKRNENKL